MERVVIDDVESDVAGDATRHSLMDPLDTSHVAINHYRLAPGERAAGLHARPGRRRRYRRRCLPWVWLRDHGLNDPLDDHVDHPDRPSATIPPRRPVT